MSDVYVVGVDMTKFQKAGTGPNVDVLGSSQRSVRWTIAD